MRLPGVLVFFVILTVIFGIWGFAVGTAVWPQAQGFFWVCLGVSVFLAFIELVAWGRSRRQQL